MKTLLVVAGAIALAGCAAADRGSKQNASRGPADNESAPYMIASLWGVPKCSRYGSGERLILKSGKRKDLKPALDYFLRTHDLSECWFVDIFTDEKALAEFIVETSASADSASDAAKQMLTSNYLQFTNDPSSHERWYGIPVHLPNGRWEDQITNLR